MNIWEDDNWGLGCRGVCLGQVETELEAPVVGGKLSAKKLEADYKQFISLSSFVSSYFLHG